MTSHFVWALSLNTCMTTLLRAAGRADPSFQIQAKAWLQRHILHRWGCLWAQHPVNSLGRQGDSQVALLVGGRWIGISEVAVCNCVTLAQVPLRLTTFQVLLCRESSSPLGKLFLLQLPTTL